MTRIRILSLFVIGLFSSVLLAPTAFAQEAPAGDDADTGESTIVADVRITDVAFTEENGVLTGKFLLSNYLGNQEQITYGVIAQNPASKIVESLALATDISLRKGESRWVDFTYPVPSHLGGEIRFSLVTNTNNGLPLSVQPLLTRTFLPRDVTLSCTTTEKRDTLSCVSREDATLVVKYSLGSEFSEPVQTDTVTVVKDQVLTLSLPSRPALYFVTVRDTVTQESVRMTVRVPGEYGLIRSVVLDEGATELVGIVTALASPVVGSRLVVTLTDDAGVACGETMLPIDTAALNFSVTPTCERGQVTFALLGGTGTALATQAMPFALVPSIPVASVPGDQPETTFLLIGLAVLVSVLILVGLFWWSKRQTSSLPPVTPLLFMAVVSIGLYAPQASAVTLSEYSWGANGEISYILTTTVTPDKAAYPPGGTMVINASTTVMTDAGAEPGPNALTSGNTSYNKDTGGVRWDSTSYASASPILTNAAPLTLGNDASFGPIIGSAIEVLPGAMPTGSHYVRIRMNYDTTVSAATQVLDNMTFTVATINVGF